MIAPGTPLPWALPCGDGCFDIKLATVWREGAWDGDAEAKANAAYIVHACNLYPELLEAWIEWFAARDTLAELERQSDTTKRFDNALYAQEAAENKARAALAKAGAA